MRTLQEKYNAVLEGKFSKTQFRRDAAIELPQFISNVNSFDDTVAILKNKGIVTEAKKQEPKYSTAKPADQVAPDVLDTGIKFELDKKYGTLDVTPEQYEKCREMAIKNLSKDVLYYVKQDSIQLDEPGEKMEKVKLKENSHFEKRLAKLAAAEKEKREKNPKYAAASKLGVDIEDFIEKGQSYQEFKKRLDKLEEETDEAIQNIENDEYTVKRIAKLTNQLLKANPEDHSVKAYAISVKNDLESGDASRLKRYKNLLSVDHLKDDMEHFISHDVDQLEEDLSEPDVKDLYQNDTNYINQLKKREKTDIGNKVHRAQSPNKLKEEEEDLSKPDPADLYQNDTNYINQLKKREKTDIGNKVHRAQSPNKLKEEREALKEMFKKIITKIITEEVNESTIVTLPMTVAGYTRDEVYDVEYKLNGIVKKGRVKIIDKKTNNGDGYEDFEVEIL